MVTAARAALERLDELAVEEWTLDDMIERVRGLYEFRQRRVKVWAGKLDDDGIEDRSLAYQRLMHELYTVQRRVVELRNGGVISNDVMHRSSGSSTSRSRGWRCEASLARRPAGGSGWAQGSRWMSSTQWTCSGFGSTAGRSRLTTTGS